MAWVRNALGLLPSPQAAQASLHPATGGPCTLVQVAEYLRSAPGPGKSHAPAEVLCAESKLQQHVMFHAAADAKE